jgi:hypothetical protein
MTFGPLRVEQLLLIVVMIVAVTGFLLRARAPRRLVEPQGPDIEAQPA